MMPVEKEPLCSTNQVGSESPQVPNLGSLAAKLVFMPTSAQHRANIAQHKESTASVSLINCCPSSSVCQLITLLFPTVLPCVWQVAILQQCPGLLLRVTSILNVQAPLVNCLLEDLSCSFYN